MAPDGDANDTFGNAVTVYGDWIAVGAHKADQVATNAGAVYMFRNIEGTWTYQQKLEPADIAGDDWFGSSVEPVSQTP